MRPSPVGLVPFAICTFALVALPGACTGPGKHQLRGATTPVGPYSPGIDCGDYVFLAGQIGKDPATGKLVPGGIEAETHQVLKNLGAVLREAGLDYGDVVKSSVFLADVGDFAVMNGIYQSYFPEGGIPPVRTTVQVAAIPTGARIEIDFIAARR
jgi:2-iminobutanoate/2-iminopropanoate deaminase